ncbi:MAG: S-layer homology domain-containing protein [Clostridiales Family XIII bacterium]|nr:S-layer homology domain-containing protein [Clostridiales Family XIII bacterium]
MKRMCTLLLATLVLTGGSVSAAFAAGVYPQDIINTTYFVAVSTLMDIRAITGDDDGLFHPEKPITRAECSALLARSTNNKEIVIEEAAKKEYFSDLDDYGWVKGYINRCYENGWIKGSGEGRFDPGDDATYAEVITMLIRVKRRGGELEGSWPRNYIEYATMYNMPGDVTIKDWNAPAAKGDVAKLVYRIIDPADAF